MFYSGVLRDRPGILGCSWWSSVLHIHFLQSGEMSASSGGYVGSVGSKSFDQEPSNLVLIY